MKSQTKALMILAAAATLTMGARAQEQEQPAPMTEKPTEFKCPTCGSPCINKAELIRHNRINMRNKARQLPENAQAPALRQRINAQAQRQGAPAQAARAERIPAEARQAIKERAMKFDIDGDGELSQPERAAMRAYRSAMREARTDAPESRPAAQPEVAE